MNIFEELEWRGLMADCTDVPELRKRLEHRPDQLFTAASIPRPTACTSATWFPCSLCGAFNCSGPPSHRAGGRRHRVHRRPQRQDARAPTADQGSAGLQHRLCQRAVAPAARFRRPRPIPPAFWITRTGPLRSAFSISCATSASIFQSIKWWPRKACAPAWKIASRASATPSSATCCCRPLIFTSAPRPQLRAANWRHRSMGQHHRRHRSHAQKIGQDGLWSDRPAHHQLRRHEIRQDRRRRHLAGRRKDQRLSVLPILDSHRRPRCHPLSEILSPFSARKKLHALAAAHAQKPEARVAHQRLGRSHDRSHPRPQRHRRSHARERNSFWRRFGRHFRSDLQ